jgi:hypothetical protein
MPKLSQLQMQTTLTLALMGDSKIAQSEYPDNEWGITLKHYDAHVEWFRTARLETREENIRQNAMMQWYPEQEKASGWNKWHDSNPKQPSIPYDESLYEAMKQALNFFKNPPEPIRDCLRHLAEGNDLHPDDLFVFLQLYAEFMAALEILYAYNPDTDHLKNQREAWNKTNKERWQRYAALEIKKIMKEYGKSIEEAKAIFAFDIRESLDGRKPIPPDWTREDYAEFLVVPKNKKSKAAPRLKNSRGQDLTLKDVNQCE